MKPMQIYHANPNDWQRCQSIRIRALRDSPDAFATTLEQALQVTEKNWQSRLMSEENATFLANLNGEDIGLAVGAPYDECAGLYAMWVAPEARGFGAGDSLIHAVVNWAAGKGYRRIFLDVGDTNTTAIALYKRNGFVATGVIGTLDPTREHIKEHQRCKEI